MYQKVTLLLVNIPREAQIDSATRELIIKTSLTSLSIFVWFLYGDLLAVNDNIIRFSEKLFCIDA